MVQDIEDLRVWNRTILDAIWKIISLLLLIMLSGILYEYMLGEDDIQSLIVSHLFTPFKWLLVIMIVTEVTIRWVKKFTDFCVIIAATLILTVFIIDFSQINSIHNILFLSTLVAAFYYEEWRVYFSLVLNTIIFLILYRYNETFHNNLDGHDLIVTLFIFTACSILSLGIMSRGTFLMNKLKYTMEEQQKLMIHNVTMDRITKIDALTELYNHKTFHEYLDRLIDQNSRMGFCLHLAMLDIDNFKQINDKFGHQVGDIVLSVLADRLRECVSPNDFICRYGGEEFAIIFVDQSDEEVLACAERIRSSVADMVVKEMQGQAVTISIGVQAYSEGVTKEEWFRYADQCLYEAKRTGKNKIANELTGD